jgi:hypothetical protein
MSAVGVSDSFVTQDGEKIHLIMFPGGTQAVCRVEFAGDGAGSLDGTASRSLRDSSWSVQFPADIQGRMPQGRIDGMVAEIRKRLAGDLPVRLLAP